MYLVEVIQHHGKWVLVQNRGILGTPPRHRTDYWFWSEGRGWLPAMSKDFDSEREAWDYYHANKAHIDNNVPEPFSVA